MSTLTLNEILRRKMEAAPEEGGVSIIPCARFNALHVMRGKILLRAFRPDQIAEAQGYARRVCEGTIEP